MARGARIYAEVVGFGTNSDGEHMTQPRVESMSAVMRMALADARLEAGAIGYVELAYAIQTKTPFAALKNKSGNYVEPSIESTIAATDGRQTKGHPLEVGNPKTLVR